LSGEVREQENAAWPRDAFLAEERIITIGEITNTRMADIDQLFVKNDQVALCNAAFGKKIEAAGCL
jgi:hypothetical protein